MYDGEDIKLGSDKDKEIVSAVDSRLEDIFGDAHERSDVIEDEATSSAVSRGIDALLGDDPPVTSHPKVSEPKNKPKKAKLPKKPDPMMESGNANKLLLNELKSVVLSLEWEITDQVMQTLEDEIKKLEETFKDEKITVAFLQLLSSLGKYIRKKKADAHPDSMVLIRSVFDSMETVVMSPEMSESVKKKMLITEVNKYKELKTQIAQKPEVTKKQEQKPSAPEIVPERKEEVEIKKPVIEEPTPPSEIIIPPFSLADQGGEPIPITETADSEKTEEPQYSYGYPGEVNFSDIIQVLYQINETIKSEFRLLREELRLLIEKR